MYGYVCLCTALFKQQKTFSVCTLPYKHERGWENSRQLFKPETIRLVFDDPGDGDIHTISPSHSPNDVRQSTQEILTMKQNEKSQTNRPPQHENNQSTINSIIMLIDSNGKYIDCARFSPRTPTHQYFTPTITSATDLLTTNDLGNPSHIIIQTGTNDLEKLRTSQFIRNYHELYSNLFLRNTHRQKLSSHHSSSAKTVSINKGKNLIQNLDISAPHTQISI